MKLDKPNPEAKHVDENFKLIYSSPSAIESFNVKSTWGCQRKWWLEQVAGLKSPPDASQANGEAIHKQIEHYLFTSENKLGPEATNGKHNIDEVKARHPRFELEAWIPKGFAINNVGIRGRLDFTGRDVSGLITGIVDWKTSSSIAKYGKLPNQLRTDTQMLVYRQYAEEAGCLPELPMSLVYFQTKGRASEIVETKIDRKQLASGMRDIISTLDEMKVVAQIRDSNDVPPDRSKCDIGRGCPHRSHCLKGTPMGSLLDRLKSASAPSTAPVKDAMIAQAAVLPPDAPKSDPALASQATEAPEQPQDTGIVPAPKRGRPFGSKNVKIQDVEAAPAPAVKATTVTEVPTMTVSEVVVSQGMTVPLEHLGKFFMARVDVSLKANLSHGFDAEKAREMLSKRVAAAVEAELERYLANPELAAK